MFIISQSTRQVLDEEERQDELNRILRDRLNGTVLVPFPPEDVDEPAVLDLGYGKGAWIDDLLAEYGDCVVTGVDIFLGDDVDEDAVEEEDNDTVEEFIKKRWNLNAPFAQDRSESRLRPETFDLINCRCLAEGIDRDRWPALIGELKRLLKPGGRIQMAEAYYCFQSDNGRLAESSVSNAWWSWYNRFMDISGRDARIGRQLERYCQAQGFEQIVATQYRMSIGGWEPGRASLGRQIRHNLLQLMGSFAVPFVRTAGMPPQVCRQVGVGAREELSRDDIKAYYVM
ncbi:hypothetical protein AMS68_006557 [Peltaster fructicola]|uniref:Methyltransferase domain-containing protein n=1 Tax=Peltaster fructicola TaxID=286661 RepID=A0A6H0Y316_9PEZI|nr:hypothetical protein AMS68_006557 [Peltaster fructicola]